MDRSPQTNLKPRNRGDISRLHGQRAFVASKVKAAGTKIGQRVSAVRPSGQLKPADRIKSDKLRWQPLALFGSLFAILGAALYWKLDSMLLGYNQAELDTYQQSLGLSGLLDNPLHAPLLLLLRGLLFIDPGNLLITRIASALFGLGVLAAFCWLLKRWHGNRVALIGTALFGLSAWFLHTARLGTPEVLMYGAFALTACGFWLKQSRKAIALAACFGLTIVLLYVPGMVWFITAGVIWQWKTIDQALKRHLVIVSFGGLALFAALTPLVWAIYKDTSLLMPWLGLPNEWPNLITVAKNLLAIPYNLFVANNASAATWLGKAPILDVFSGAMFVVGCYVYLKRLRLSRTPLIITMLVVGIILAALGGPVSIGVIAPFVYLVAAAGAGYLLYQWFNVFPRNPIARGLGVFAFTVVLCLALAYHLNHYFIGWPQATATHESHTIQNP